MAEQQQRTEQKQGGTLCRRVERRADRSRERDAGCRGGSPGPPRVWGAARGPSPPWQAAAQPPAAFLADRPAQRFTALHARRDHKDGELLDVRSWKVPHVQGVLTEPAVAADFLGGDTLGALRRVAVLLQVEDFAVAVFLQEE